MSIFKLWDKLGVMILQGEAVPLIRKGATYASCLMSILSRAVEKRQLEG